MTIEWKPDPIHILFLTGLMSTISAALAHVLTKWRMSERFMTREETAEHIKSAVQIAVKEVMAKCIEAQAVCPIRTAVIDIKELKDIQREFPIHDVVRDIAEIRKVQSERTVMLKQQTRTLFELLMVMMSELKIAPEKQNDMLRGLS